MTTSNGSVRGGGGGGGFGGFGTGTTVLRAGDRLAGSPDGCAGALGFRCARFASIKYKTSGSRRVDRGGCFGYGAAHLRAGTRVYASPGYHGGTLGFRCARSFRYARDL